MNNQGENISKALPKLMGAMSNAKNSVQGYGYKYAPLNEILDVIRPILTKQGFSLIQMVGHHEGLVSVTTRLVHESGEYIESTMALPPTEISKTNEVQQIGASITYARRYMITAILGIAGEEDIDGRPEGHRGDRKTQPTQVDDVDNKVLNAEKMVAAIIEGAKGKVAIEEYESMSQQLHEVLKIEGSEERYKALRGLYSNVNNYLKNIRA